MFENQSELASFIRNHPSFEDFFDTSSFSHMMTYPYEGVFIAFFYQTAMKLTLK